ncbi:MAG TPA: glycosyl hydrolase family 28-related protein, partial [Hanamia sp.]|nr:glycosyl hydrolase family 28-related protein [Hanamia sp.]
MKQILLLMAIVSLFAFSSTGQTPNNLSGFYNVKNAGAKGNGQDLDTKYINAAIEEASKAGGGTVYFPAGNYLSGSIHLKSNIPLYLDNGATLIAAPSENN